MPQYTSSFRNNIRRERIADDSYSRTINFNLSDYGTISTTDYQGNADLFKRVYSDVINRIYDPNVRVYITVPAGDYFFTGVSDVNQYTTLQAPQFGQIVIVGAELSGTRPSSTTLASQTRDQNYASLAAYHRTRFHFIRNGFSIAGMPGGFSGSSGFQNIGFFGSWNGAPGTLSNDTVSRRGFQGSTRLESCSIFGFDGDTYESGAMYLDGSHSSINFFNLTICNCNRGIVTSSGASAYGDFSSTDMLVNYRAEALIAYGNSSIKLGDDANIRSTISVGAYSAYAYDSSAIVIRNPSVSGGAGMYARPDGSTIHTSTSY